MRVERQPRVSQELHLPKRIGQSATYLLFSVILLQTQCNGRHVPLTKPSGYKVCFYQYTVIASLPCPSGIWLKCKIVSRKTAILDMLYCIICIDETLKALYIFPSSGRVHSSANFDSLGNVKLCYNYYSNMVSSCTSNFRR